jgi:hypothetical protein
MNNPVIKNKDIQKLQELKRKLIEEKDQNYAKLRKDLDKFINLENDNTEYPTWTNQF